VIQPIAADHPCGENLEDTALLASFDAFHVFGNVTPPEPPPDWGLVRTRANEALARSKDVRVLSHLATALLHTDGLLPFLDTLLTASQWLDMYWDHLFPVVDEDLLSRRNALTCFADRVAVVDALRRRPVVISRQHGSFTLRDMDIAAGLQPAAKGEVAPDKARIAAALADMSVDELVPLQERVAAGLAALKAIEATMLEHGGVEAVPSFDALAAPLARLDKMLRGERTSRGLDAPPTHGEPAQPHSGDAPVAAPPADPMVPGGIRTRQDAIRVLDAVIEYFNEHEPSSPVPLVLDRAKRLVSKSFLEVLADIAPAAVEQAKVVGGLNKA
jgi:type VI secretion system protein ImpA